MGKVNVTYNGSNTHTVRDVKTSKIAEGIVLTTGYVSGKLISLHYSGEMFSQYGSVDAKPWLKQVREDLVRKYIETYGDQPGKTRTSDEEVNYIMELHHNGVPVKDISKMVKRSLPTVYKIIKDNTVRKIVPTIKVDENFLDLLKAEGFDVIAGVVGLPYGVNVCITDLTQIDAINAIKRGIVKSEALKAKAEAAERAEIKRLFEELIKDSKMA